MEALRHENYISVILLAVLYVECSHASTQRSALISHVINVPNGASSSTLIYCAFQLMKVAFTEKSFVKIASGTDVCEQLDRRLPALMDSDFFEEGYDYLQKISSYVFLGPENNFPDMVEHYLYSKVEIGDTFSFVVKKSDTGKLRINFRDVVSSDTSVLMFTDNSMMLKIEDSYNNDDGALVIPVYPFEDFQIYKILFELLEAHWRISINGVVLTTFDYRIPLENIAMIRVKYGLSIKYLSKAFNPRNQPQNITGW